MKTQCVKQIWLSDNCRDSPFVCQWQDTTCTANPVITATWHSGGCIFVCPASFIPVTITDPHSTKVGLLSHIST